MAKSDIRITYSFGKTAINSKNEQETALEVICQKQGKPLADEEVEFFVEGKSVEKKKTDTAGEVDFLVKCPQNVTAVKGELQSASGGKQRWSLNIAVVPSATAAPIVTPVATPAPKQLISDTNNPVELQVLRTKLSKAGKFRLFARVLDQFGMGMKKKKVSFIRQGNYIEVETDKEGVCQFPSGEDSINLRPGTKEEVVAFVSGISELTTTTICRRKQLTQVEKDRTSANNKRAKIFWICTGIAWTIWFIDFATISNFYGWGEPLSLISKPTEQEKFFQDLLVQIGTAVPEKTGLWQKNVLFFPLVFLLPMTIFSLLYGLFSCREEIGEAWESVLNKFTDKHYLKARDPLFDRFASWSGHLTRATVPPATESTTAAPDSKPMKTRFWDHFRSDLLSDFLIELLPKIFATILGGRK